MLRGIVIVVIITLASVSRTNKCFAVEVANMMNGDLGNLPSSMPTEHKKAVEEQYKTFMEERARKKKEEQERNKPPPPPEGPSPMKMGLTRADDSGVALTKQIGIKAGHFWFGSQTDIGGKVMPSKTPDGGEPRKKAKVKSFLMDVDAVTNEQFQDFVESTQYITESELYGWSFVLDSQASEEVIEEVDGEMGYGRVKDAKHWMAVKFASWRTPYGIYDKLF